MLSKKGLRKAANRDSVVLRDAILERELVEQPALIPPLPPYHRAAPAAADQSATVSGAMKLS